MKASLCFLLLACFQSGFGAPTLDCADGAAALTGAPEGAAGAGAAGLGSHSSEVREEASGAAGGAEDAAKGLGGAGAPSGPGVDSLTGAGKNLGGGHNAGGCASGLCPSTPLKHAPIVGPVIETKDRIVGDAKDVLDGASHLDINKTSQAVLNAADHAAIGVAKTADQIVPGVGTLALGIYSVPSGIAHGAAAGVSGIAVGVSGGPTGVLGGCAI